jgi:hypothetical protein
MKFVMFYETDLEKLPLARAHYPGHRARLDEFHSRGTLLMAGPFAGVVKKFSVLPWNEVLA